MNAVEVENVIRSVLPTLVSMAGLTGVRVRWFDEDNARADFQTQTLFLNPAWLAGLADPFVGRNNWSPSEHYTAIVGILTHELGHLRDPARGHSGELSADGFAAEVLGLLGLPHEPLSTFLFGTTVSLTHPGGFERMKALQNRWAQAYFFDRWRRAA